MLCIYCANDKTKVAGVSEGKQLERFRYCEKCNQSWLTVEACKNDSKFWEDYKNSLYGNKENHKNISYVIEKFYNQ